MSVSVVEGRVVEAPVKSRRKALVRFDHVDFEHRDGRTERFAKLVGLAEVADAVRPGAEGRFYLFKTIDVKGIHGVRLADGTERFAYPRNNLLAFGLSIPVALAWITVKLFDSGGVPLLGLFLLGLGGVGFSLTWTNRVEARRQFDADAGAARRPTPAPQAASRGESRAPGPSGTTA
jgi:hypothetical protein